METDSKKEYSKLIGIVGLLLIIASWILSFFETAGSNLSYISYVVLGIGVFIEILAVILGYPFIRESFMKRGTKKRLTSTLIIIIVGTVFVSLYYIAKVHLKWEKDLSTKLFSLSKQSKDAIKALKSPLNIIVLSEKEGIEDNTRELLKAYQDEKKEMIEIKYRPPFRYPELFDRYKIPKDPRGLGAIVIEKQNSKPPHYLSLLRQDLYELVPSRGRPREIFKGENKITENILLLQETKKLIIYNSQGHGEKSFENTDRNGYSQLKNSLLRENYQIKKISLLTEKKVPEDCDLLIIASPIQPFGPKEIEAVKSYLKKGGKALILMDPEVQKVKPGLNKLLAEWSIKSDHSIILDPKATAVLDRTGRVFQVGLYGYHQIIKELSNKNLRILFYLARPFWIDTDKQRSNVTITPLIFSSELGWGERDPLNPRLDKNKPDPSDLKGPVNYVLAVEEKLDKDKKIRLVLIGDSDFLTNEMTKGITSTLGYYGNAKDLFMNSMSWLTNQEKKITIRPKEVKRRTLDLIGNRKTMIWVVSLLILPFSIVGIGLFVYSKKKKMK